METERCEIGMIGLGVMGRNMLLNMSDHGFAVASYDKDPGKVEALQKESAEHDTHSVANIKDFIGLIRKQHRSGRIPLPRITPSNRGRPSVAAASAGNTWAGSPWRAAR
jgi:6-phosphogluconate dehydrogenase (decarboxylating)